MTTFEPPYPMEDIEVEIVETEPNVQTTSHQYLVGLLNSLEMDIEKLSADDVFLSIEKALFMLVKGLAKAIAEDEPPDKSIVTSRAVSALSKAAEIESRRLEQAKKDQDVDLTSPKQQKIFAWFIDLIVDVAKNELPAETTATYIQVLSERLDGWEEKVTNSLKGVKSHLLSEIENPLV